MLSRPSVRQDAAEARRVWAAIEAGRAYFSPAPDDRWATA
jgi:hypothetical protein